MRRSVAVFTQSKFQWVQQSFESEDAQGSRAKKGPRENWIFLGEKGEREEHVQSRNRVNDRADEDNCGLQLHSQPRNGLVGSHQNVVAAFLQFVGQSRQRQSAELDRTFEDFEINQLFSQTEGQFFSQRIGVIGLRVDLDRVPELGTDQQLDIVAAFESTATHRCS